MVKTKSSSRESDINFARRLSKGDKDTLQQFLKDYSDLLFYIARKFCRYEPGEDHWEYITKSKKIIHVSDCVSDTYLWLIKISQNKSRSYKGNKGAKFSTYLSAILNSNFTFKDWLKWKYGITGYVPMSIKSLGTIYSKIYKYLRQNKPDEYIINNLEIDVNTFNQKKEKILSTLSEANLSHLLYSPSFIPFPEYAGNNGGMKEVGFADSESIDIEDHKDLEDVVNILEKMIKSLDIGERRLLQLYWGAELSVKQIFELLNEKDLSKHFSSFKIKAPKTIYKVIDEIIIKIFNCINLECGGFSTDYNLTKQSLKEAIKIYLHNWSLEE